MKRPMRSNDPGGGSAPRSLRLAAQERDFVRTARREIKTLGDDSLESFDLLVLQQRKVRPALVGGELTVVLSHHIDEQIERMIRPIGNGIERSTRTIKADQVADFFIEIALTVGSIAEYRKLACAVASK